MRLAYGARQLLTTPRGRSLFALSTMSAFGVVSGLLGFVASVFDTVPERPLVFAGFALAACGLWGAARTYPRSRLEYELSRPEMTMKIVVDDLFAQDTHLVVGFSDTFDTSTDGDQVISRASLQGQLVGRRFGDDVQLLDRALRGSLAKLVPVASEARAEKRLGKLRRYPIGTVVALGEHPSLVFAVALSRMGNNLVAHATVDDLWISLGRVWEAVRQTGQRTAVSIPLLGSGLARVDALDANNLTRLILLSFVTHSRRALVARELRVVIHPGDVGRVDLIALNAFLRSL